jgi:small subunit ribosomal protein S17
MRILKYKKNSRPRVANAKRHSINAERVKMHVSRGDSVRVMRGEDKGKEGKVLRVFTKTGAGTSGRTAGTQNAADRNSRKTREGLVVSDKMQKTVVVAIDRRVPHPVYGKMVTRTKRLKAHDEENSAKQGDTVRIMETRPLSKDKRWRVVEIVERAR